MIKVRIAPSPTGDPHVGTAYVALFNWVFARRHGGAFILRIEDTDQARSTPESEKAIMESLAWLGLDWDEGPVKGGPNGPYRQSERTAIYQEHANLLIEKGVAYPCFCSAERIADLRVRQKKAKETLGYDGLCRGLPREEAARRREAGEPHVVRLKVDKEAVTVFKDLLRDEIRVENSNVDDQILIKTDGYPTYHLANVVDDHLMGVTHVIRAEEWIASTPKHVMLYEAFGWEPAVFVHLPLLRNKDKSKISKRKNPTSLSHYRDQGYLPEALLNFLALMGWSTSDEEEVFDRDRMIQEMDLARIRLGSPVFDLDKLDWLNGVYIRNLAPAALADRLEAGFLKELKIDRDLLLKLIPLARERMKTLSDFTAHVDYFFEAKNVTFEDFNKCKLAPDRIKALLEEAATVLEKAGTLNAETADPLLRECAERMEVKPGQLFMCLRVAVTGRTVSPPLLESMEILGLKECLRRMQKTADRLAGETG